MANSQSYPTLSDGLAALIRTFEPTRTTGMVMTRRNVATFLDGLQVMLDEARLLEKIVDRAEWNEKARRDARQSLRDSLEAGIADGSVELLPVVPRSTAAHQGEGGAA